MGALKLVVLALIVIGVVFVFAYKPQLTIATTAGGTTNPSPGTYTYYFFESPTITATPESGWLFSHWELDNEIVIGAENSIKISGTFGGMNTNHALRAVFEPVAMRD
jgi:hypothetical protein